MRFVKSPFIVLVLLLPCMSCSPEPVCPRSGIAQWELGWRMIENSWAEEHALAVAQFDSLRECPARVDLHFWNYGLQSLKSAGREETYLATLKSLDVDVLQQLSEKAFFAADLKALAGFVPRPVPALTHPELSVELIKMYLDDQYCRGNLMEDVMQQFGLEAYSPSASGMEAVDMRNQNRLREVLRADGFPTVAMVGKVAVEGAFMVIQHAGNDPAWQASLLPQVRLAFEKGELEGQHYALLCDRVLLRQGKAQLYGTQIRAIDPATRVVELEAVEAPEQLDERRMELGMSPISVYKKIVAEVLG